MRHPQDHCTSYWSDKDDTEQSLADGRAGGGTQKPWNITANSGYVVSGSTNQPTINGEYHQTSRIENGRPVFRKKGSSVFLYWLGSSTWWVTRSTRSWSTGTHPSVDLEDFYARSKDVLQGGDWQTYKEDAWVDEPSVLLTPKRAHPPRMIQAAATRSSCDPLSRLVPPMPRRVRRFELAAVPRAHAEEDR